MGVMWHLTMVQMHLKLDLGLCVGGGRVARVHYKGGGWVGLRWLGVVVGGGLSAHQTLTMWGSGQQVAHWVSWGASCRGGSAGGREIGGVVGVG